LLLNEQVFVGDTLRVPCESELHSNEAAKITRLNDSSPVYYYKAD